MIETERKRQISRYKQLKKIAEYSPNTISLAENIQLVIRHLEGKRYKMAATTSGIVAVDALKLSRRCLLPTQLHDALNSIVNHGKEKTKKRG